MTGNFNLNNQQFDLNSYKNNDYLKSLRNPAELYQTAQSYMEEQEIAQAEKEIKKQSFGSLTLSEKLLELGVGKKVLEQIGDTALGVVRATVDPITNYLKDYEKVYTPGVLDSELQSYAKQMFFANNLMNEEDNKNPVGRKFVYNM